MDIVFIGAGNLATNLSHALHEAGHKIVQVYSRTEASAKALADDFGCPFTNNEDQIVVGPYIYIICVTDSALAEVAQKVTNGREDCLFVHTAGSMQMDVLPSKRRGVFYPMQTFTKARLVNFTDIPVFVEASENKDADTLLSLAKTISKKVYELSSADRQYLHLAAVFCCNFANHCYTLSEEILGQHGIPFEVMNSLIDETAAKVHNISPSQAQTGPAARKDENVIRKHLQLLDDNPRLQTIYDIMTKSIAHD